MLRFLLILGTATILVACAGQGVQSTGPAVYADIAAISAGAAKPPAVGLTASGQPDAAAVEAFASAGYVAVIDLRTAAEDRGSFDEASVVKAAGLEYASLPIDGADDITFESARRLDALLAGYSGPVLVHCGSGNRVGALLALRESLHGADDAAALEYGQNAGLTRLEPRVRQVLESK